LACRVGGPAQDGNNLEVELFAKRTSACHVLSTHGINLPWLVTKFLATLDKRESSPVGRIHHIEEKNKCASMVSRGAGRRVTAEAPPDSAMKHRVPVTGENNSMSKSGGNFHRQPRMQKVPWKDDGGVDSTGLYTAISAACRMQ
jgi:hypothetical protein